MKDKEPRSSKSGARRKLGQINAGVDALLIAAQNPDQEQRDIFYREIGQVLLEILPKRVTELRLTADVFVKREVVDREPKEWTLFRMEDYAEELAGKAGAEYKRRFSKKKKKK